MSYGNFSQALVSANLIKSDAYSLWLDDLEAITGSMKFGVFDEYAEPIITPSSMRIVNGDKTNSLNTDLPTAVILDSGSSLTYLPNANAIHTALDVQYTQRSAAAFASCDLANGNITLDFSFTSLIISVPIRELVLSIGSVEEGRENPNPSDNSEGFYISGGSDENICLFGIAPSQGSTPVLGDTFLRSAYVVYDLANNEISRAQTDSNSTTSHVVEIGIRYRQRTRRYTNDQRR